MRTDKTPGFNNDNELDIYRLSVFEKYITPIIEFVSEDSLDGTICDIGNSNPKMEYLKEIFDINLEQVTVNDFNFDVFPDKQYDVIFCFEILEHLQNPLFFMTQIKKMMKDNGTLYLSMPSNPRFMWATFHFFEMSKKHFEKWILVPLDLKIVRHRKWNHSADRKAMLIGIRPLIRMLLGKQSPMIIINAIFQIHNIYEIKHK
jgi:SAM-dependent methyltransferase